VHYICSTFGSAGDVFPLLGLALELRRRGHEVTFATNEHFRKVIESYGLPYEPLGTEEDFKTCIQNPDLWHPKRAFRHVLQSLQPALKRQYDIHAERSRAGQVISITNCFGFGALMAQEKLGLPVITLHLQPAALWSDRQPPTLPGLFGPRWLKSLLYCFAERYFIDPVVCPFLNQWRHELGLPPVRKITRWWNSRFGLLCMFPDWYCPQPDDWPSGLMQTDFPLWNHKAAESLAPEVEIFLARGEPPIVFTPGSANLHGQQFFTSAVHACQTLGRRGILLTEFAEHLPAQLPDTVAHFNYIPLDLLLQKAAAFVHHGGIGSTSQAMLAGIPQFLMPLAHDQFDNAARIKRLRIGDSIPSHKFTGPRLTKSLHRLLGSATITNECRNVAVRLAKRDGISRSVDEIEARVVRSATMNG
jgi:rhamnosyltransferase subunit B